jgi:hypothetical protein
MVIPNMCIGEVAHEMKLRGEKTTFFARSKPPRFESQASSPLQEPVAIQIALGAIGAEIGERLEAEQARPAFELLVRDLVAISWRRRGVVPEAQQEVAGLELAPIELVFRIRLGRSSPREVCPFHLPAHEAIATSELPCGHGEEATGLETVSGSAKQGGTPFAPWDVMEHSHQGDQGVPGLGQVITRGVRAKEILPDPMEGMPGGLWANAPSSGLEQGFVGVDSRVLEAPAGLEQEMSETSISATDVEHAERRPGQRLENAVPAGPGKVYPTRIECLGVGLVEGERESVELAPGRKIHLGLGF